jgi:hypothetical protein
VQVKAVMSTPKTSTAAENLRRLSRDITGATKAQYRLVRRIRELELKIRLIVSNVYLETLPSSNRSQGSGNAGAKSGSGGQGLTSLSASTRTVYEDLLSLLRGDVRYLAALTIQARSAECDALLQLVVLSLFGNQYAPSEERRLLDMFALVLRREYDACKNIGEFMRSNSAITKMLTVFSQRAPFRDYVVSRLKPTLEKIAADKTLNLELKPSRVFAEFPELGSNIPDDDAASKNEKVRSTQGPRIRQTEEFCSAIVDAYLQSLDDMPYGLRFICNRIHDEGVARFGPGPAVLALVGGFLFLRVITPMVASPKVVLGATEQTLTPNQRKSLIVIAKVLQNLSNGILYGEKEEYMVPLNPFLQKYRPRIEKYFENVCKLDSSLEKKQEADLWLSLAVERPEAAVDVSVSELKLIHSMCLEHEKMLVAISNAPVTAPLSASIPAAASSSTAASTAAPAPASSSSSSAASASPSTTSSTETPVSLSAPDAPGSQRLGKMVDILKALRAESVPTLEDQTTVRLNLLQDLPGKSAAGTSPTSPSSPLPDQPLSPAAEVYLSEKADAVKSIADRLSLDCTYLEEKVRLYEQYLKNVRTKEAYYDPPAEQKCKFTFEDLVKRQVVVEHDIPAQLVQSRVLRVVMVNPEPGTYAVAVKAGPASIFESRMFLDDLLEMRACRVLTVRYEVEQYHVTMSVEGLIGLINELFIRKRK